MSKDLIIGFHSIFHALKNPKRKIIEVLATDKGLQEYKKQYSPIDANVRKLKPHDFQTQSEKLYKEAGFKFQKITSGVLLVAESLEYKSHAWLYDHLEKNEKVTLLALDQVTDIQNAGAILRTAAFYNIDALIIGMKGSFSLTPSFFRNASGAFEHVPFIQVPSLSKTLKTLSDKNVKIIGLSEEASDGSFERSSKECFIMGSEDTGLSHAVERCVDYNIALKAAGEIESLNVSVATAVTLERFLKS